MLHTRNGLPLVQIEMETLSQTEKHGEANIVEHTNPEKLVNPKELTVFGVILLVVLGMVLAAANTYLGLFSGFPVSVSIPSAIISMGLQKICRRFNNFENNIVQTGASASSVLVGGIIVVVPALLEIKFWDQYHYWPIAGTAAIGGLIGILFSIPLRRILIVEEKLCFPEGVATAEVLKVGEAGTSSLLYITFGAILGALFKFGEIGLKFWNSESSFAFFLGPLVLHFGLYTSPALFSVGYIVNIKIAIVVFMGAVTGWWILTPILGTIWGIKHSVPDPMKSSLFIFENHVRYVGVGAMVVGSIFAIVELRRGLWNGLKSSCLALRLNWKNLIGSDKDRTERDLPIPLLAVTVLILTIPLGIICYVFSNSIWISIFMVVFSLVSGFLFATAAAYMAGVVGSSNNPISGITLATLLTCAVTLWLFMGSGSSAGAASALLIATIIAVASALSSDNMQDLKTGYILGSTPFKQQIAQITGIIVPAFTIAPILSLLHNAYGIGKPTPEKPNPLPAPQARLMAQVASGVFNGQLPWTMIGIGMGIALVVVIIDFILIWRKQSFRIPVLAMATGLYLPFSLSIPILGGGFLAWITELHAKLIYKEMDQEKYSQIGLLFAAGIITGESIIGIIMAIPIVITANSNVLAPFGPLDFWWLGITLLIMFLIMFYCIRIGWVNRLFERLFRQKRQSKNEEETTRIITKDTEDYESVNNEDHLFME